MKSMKPNSTLFLKLVICLMEIVALGIAMSLAFAVIATAAGVFQKLFQNAIDIKSENDLTV